MYAVIQVMGDKMHKFTRRALGAMGAAVALMGASAAAAQVTSDFTATLDATDPTFANVFFNSGQPCNLSGSVGNRYYETRQISVTTAGTYTLQDQFINRDAGIGIYSGAFNPVSPATNCVASSEDGAVVNLVAGTYTLVLSSLGTDDVGLVTYRFNGPAAVTLGAAAAPVPTMSEWAMILFGAILAGATALHIRRRRIV